MRYDFVPLPKRKPLKWPNGARLAVIITSNLEYWDPVKTHAGPYYPGGPSIIPDTLPANVYDSANFTWREYGQRVGVWRMFEAFDEAGIPTSCACSTKLGLERPEILQAALAKGWEIVPHNHEQAEPLPPHQGDIEAERCAIRQALNAYRKTVGKAARGWLSTSMRCTPNTADILDEEGLIFMSDPLNDEQPYLIKTRSGRPLVAVPYTAEINDIAMFMRQGRDVDGVLKTFVEQFNELYREGEHSGRIMNIGLHPHVIGHPFRIRALREFLGYVKQRSQVWWPSREEIAAWYLESHASHIG